MRFLDSTWNAYGDGDRNDASAQVLAGIKYMMARYGNGGYIPGGSTVTTLSSDECLIRLADAAAHRIRCCRAGHPTPTSDCGRPGAEIEPPETT